MCATCDKIYSQIPPKYIETINSHRAELTELFSKMNKEANPDIGSNNSLGMEILFAIYVLGFLFGENRLNSGIYLNEENMLALFVSGLNEGHAAACHNKNKKVH